MHDLGRRDVDDLDAVEPVERAAIAALVTALAQGEPGPLEQLGDLVLEPALGGDGDGELRRHHATPLDGGKQALGVDGRADGRHVARRAEIGEQTVIAAAAGDLARVALSPDLDLEHEARIIFEVAAELGGEGRAWPRSMPLLPKRSKRRTQGIERGVEIDARALGDHGDALDRLLAAAPATAR